MARARAHLRWQALLLILMDAACLVAGGILGAFTRFSPVELASYVYDHVDGFVIFCSSVIIANYLAGNYRIQSTFSRFNLVVSWFFSILFAMLILSVTSYAWLRTLIGRGVLFLSFGYYSVFSVVLRQIVYRKLFRSSMFVCRVALVGPPERIDEFKALLEPEWTLPAHKVVACVAIDEKEDIQGQRLVSGVPIIRTKQENFEDVMRGLDIGLIVLSEGDGKDVRALYPNLRRLRFEGFEVMHELAVYESYAGRTPLKFLTEESMMEATLESGIPMAGRFKRLLDITAGMLIVVLFSPLMLLTALLIKLTDPVSPVFYAQERMGQFGKKFRIIKFRTMRPGAEDKSGAVWAEEDDPRITTVGKFLRRTRLDEVPQLFNVLWGHMSLVGPRPERPEMVDTLEREIPYYSERSNIPPGLTGWAQIKYPYGGSVEDTRRKLELDLYYMKNMSLRLDIQIILSTLRIMVFGKERHM